MLKALLKVRLRSLMRMFYRDTKSGKPTSQATKVIIAIVLLFAFASVGFSVGMMLTPLCKGFIALDLSWFYFGIIFIAGFFMCFISCVFSAYTQIFDAKDNDLLLSMPIPPRYILSTRVLSLLLLSYLFEAIIAIPGGIVYCIYHDVTFIGVIIYLAVCLLSPLPAIAVSCLVGWIIGTLTSRIRNKSLITTALSLLFLLAYMYFYFGIENYIQTLINNGKEIAQAVKSAVFPVYYFGDAVVSHNIWSFALFTLFCIIPFVIMYALLSVNFIRISTTKRSFAKIKYVEKAYKEKGVMRALISKELRRFASSPVYMINSALGIIFTLVIPIVLIIKSDMVFELIYSLQNDLGASTDIMSFIAPILTMSLCFLGSTDTISAPSISLEGKSIWLLQSAPIDAMSILMSKVYTHIILCVPASVIASAIFIIVFDISFVSSVFMVASPIAMIVFQAFFGVWANLKFPKLDWENETQVVKQNISVVVTMLGTMALVAVPVALYIAFGMPYMAPSTFVALFTALLILLSISIYLYFKIKGKNAFAYLS